jgi:ATP-binding cassette subfamily C protein LapB
MNDDTSSEATQRVIGYDLLTATLAYLNLLQIDIDADRLLDGLPTQSNLLTAEMMDRAVTRLGYVVTSTQSRPALRDALPCCVELASGEYLVVTARVGDQYHVLDPFNPTVIRPVNAQLLRKSVARTAYIISPSLDTLNARHSTGRKKTHWFWGRLFDSKGHLLTVAAASLFANILTVTVALFSLQVYDRVIPGASESTLWVLASGVGIAILFEAWLRISRAAVIDNLGKASEIEITRELFSKVMGMRLATRPASPGAIVHIVREFSAVKDFFTTASIGVVADLPFVFIFLLLIYGIAGSVVWIIVAGAVLIILPGLLFQSRMAQLSREAMGGSSASARLLTEVSYGLETVKTTGTESFFQKQWEEITLLSSEKTTEQRTLSSMLTFFAASTQQLAYVFAVIAGVYLVFSGDFTIGSIIAIGILSTRTLSPVSQLASVLMRWQNMKVALLSLDEVMNSVQDQDVTRKYIRRARFSGEISLKDVEFTHPGAKNLSLDITTLTLKPGERIALIGSIGSGKSTLLRLIAGLYSPGRGALLVDGLDIEQLDTADLRRNIGYLPQDVRLFRGTLRENISVGKRKSQDYELLEALKFSGLGAFVEKHSEGLDLLITDGGEGLSFGQRQSVGLARLYLMDPAIVLLDEPTASFDQPLEKDIIDKLDAWIGQRTCIIATHRTPILSIVHKVVLLVDGRVAKQSDRSKIMANLSERRAASGNETT